MRKCKKVLENKISILTLDDDPIITSTIKDYFNRSGYEVDVENDPIRAIERIRESSYDILLLDFLMSPICGDKVVEQIRTFNKELFIILLTGHKSMAPPIKTIRQLDIQGYYEKNDRFDQLELLVESCVKSIKQMRMIKEYQEHLSNAYVQTVDTLRTVVETKDKETRGHSERVSLLAAAVAQEMGLSKDDIETIRIAGLFHDIGKIGVKDSILLKNGPLDSEEFDEIKKHPVEGESIIKEFSPFTNMLPIIKQHHERMDGSGYPEHLSGDDICLGARIIAVADSFDAMMSNRAYRKGLGFEKTMAEIDRCDGVQYDSQVVDALKRMVARMGEEVFISSFCPNSIARGIQ